MLVPLATTLLKCIVAMIFLSEQSFRQSCRVSTGFEPSLIDLARFLIKAVSVKLLMHLVFDFGLEVEFLEQARDRGLNLARS